MTLRYIYVKFEVFRTNGVVFTKINEKNKYVD